ncbi:hypothetical protein AWZ03_007873 [Drosophila navojoa]|uniref:Kazal-like domain-containing protein n=1 Tax=Drosophila navojoa TaxID=7232 RepID=A0A484BD77_DRONA|nr:enhancer of split M1 protein [Drosophila navojoa]TDG45735.1 hypothetical protein AWZ03_007873 [Drosophila navojoa]
MNSQALSLCCCLALLAGIAATSVSTNETDCPQMCPAIYQPVCGTDGFNLKEFASLCNLKASNCRRARNAQTVYAATDMAWCTSKKVENLDKQLNIKLDVAGCLKPCPMIYKPLCVTNGEYRGLVSNDCSLEIFNCALMAAGVNTSKLLRILQAETC